MVERNHDGIDLGSVAKFLIEECSEDLPGSWAYELCLAYIVAVFQQQMEYEAKGLTINYSLLCEDVALNKARKLLDKIKDEVGADPEPPDYLGEHPSTP